MTNTNSGIISFENDTIQLLYNSELTIRPYLMRIKDDFHNIYEMRFSDQELKYLSEWINLTIEKNNETKR